MSDGTVRRPVGSDRFRHAVIDGRRHDLHHPVNATGRDWQDSKRV
jgi:hypothetical protein